MTRRDDQLSLPGLGSDDDAEQASARADLAARLKREWAEVDPLRRASAMAMSRAFKENDPKVAVERWKAAKLAAETLHLNMRALAVKQQSERAVCGLEGKEGDANTKKPVCEMNYEELAVAICEAGQT